MFEMTIYAQTNFLPYFVLLDKKLHTKKLNPITAIVHDSNSSMMSIAIDVKDYDTLQEKVKKYLSEYVIRYYKEQFISEHMNLVFLDAKYQDAFVKAMILYDIEEDIRYAKQSLKIRSKIYLDSFYWFVLSVIREKWIGVMEVINENMYEYISGESFLELLRFLVTMGKQKIRNVTVSYQKNGYLLTNEKGEKVDLIKDETDLICKLISLNPTNIQLSCMEHLTETTFHILNYLFQGHVHFLV